ncbi:MAG: hypothetical protein AVDCRST_MAG53-1975, partial [uncultured Solirubrobacteraceae bacterium]
WCCGPAGGVACCPSRSHEHACSCPAAGADGAPRRTEHSRGRSGGWSERTRCTCSRRDRRR